MKESEQISLFDHDYIKPIKRGGGSQNPIVFNDYDSFVTKFTDRPKTTDDCYTPQDVYEAVVEYVGTITDMTNKVVLRPFYPGGDYENAEYPSNGVVIDNPPFSIFTKICKFYTAHNIPFFLFGNGMTISSVANIATIVVINEAIEFSNKAVVNINFATNLCNDIAVMTAPDLNRAIKQCKSQNTKVGLPTYVMPEQVLRITDLQTISKWHEPFIVKRSESCVIRDLKHAPKGIFGNAWLISAAKAAAKAAAISAAKAAAISAAKAAAKAAIHIPLSREEQIIADKLQNNI